MPDRELAGTYPIGGDGRHSHCTGGEEEEEERERRKRSHLPCLVRSFDEHRGKTSLDPRSHQNYHRVNPTLRGRE